MVSIHLAHHGNSGPLRGSGPDDRPMEPGVFNHIIDTIISAKFQTPVNAHCSGTASGAGLHWPSVVDRPLAWQHAVLLAPDGLKQSPFYAITVHTHLGRWAWFWMDRHEQWVLKGQMHCSNGD